MAVRLLTPFSARRASTCCWSHVPSTMSTQSSPPLWSCKAMVNPRELPYPHRRATSKGAKGPTAFTFASPAISSTVASATALSAFNSTSKRSLQSAQVIPTTLNVNEVMLYRYKVVFQHRDSRLDCRGGAADSGLRTLALERGGTAGHVAGWPALFSLFNGRDFRRRIPSRARRDAQPLCSV